MEMTENVRSFDALHVGSAVLVKFGNGLYKLPAISGCLVVRFSVSVRDEMAAVAAQMFCLFLFHVF